MNSGIKNNILCILILILTVSCQSIKPVDNTSKKGKQLIEAGVASWYGPGFQGKKTANGEIFDTRKATAAHRTLPFGTILVVQNVNNGKEVTVRINDRGPFAKNRIIDLSKAAAEKIGMIQAGTASVQLYLKSGQQEIEVENIKKGSYTIQIASYKEYENAERKANQVPEGWVKQTKLKGQKVYRVFAGRFSDSVTAQEFLAKLKKRKISGFVKQIEN